MTYNTTGCPATRNLLSEHLEYLAECAVRTWYHKSLVRCGALRPATSYSWGVRATWLALSNIMFLMFGQHVTSVRKTCTVCSDKNRYKYRNTYINTKIGDSCDVFTICFEIFASSQSEEKSLRKLARLLAHGDVRSPLFVCYVLFVSCFMFLVSCAVPLDWWIYIN